MTAGSSPSFSMIVPTYQRRDVVCRTVEAIGKLRYDGAFELIVVIDGSDDGTEEALRRIELPIPFRLISQRNSGPAQARNRGAEEAANEILFFLDDDMICKPDLIEQHAGCYRQGADAVIGDIPMDQGSPPGFMADGVAAWSEDSTRDTTAAATLGPFHIFTGQLSVRRAVFEEIGGFDSSFTANGAFGHEDADFGIRLLRAHDVRYNPQAISLHHYTITPSQNLRRAFASGQADVAFANRHPQFAAELFEIKRAFRLRTRLIYRPLGRVPLFPRAFAAVAGRLADMAVKSPRWRSNRQVASVFYAAQQVAYWSSVHRHGGMPNSRNPLILCYHAVADHSFDDLLKTYSIPAETFIGQLESLRRRGFTFIGADDLLLYLQGLILLPRKSVLLTFDDCYTDLLDAARTILKPRGIKALAFAVTGTASGTNEWDQAFGAVPLKLLDAEGLQALRANGVDVGAHSRTHPMLPDVSANQLHSEIVGAADDFETMGLPRPKYFAYPFGGRDRRCWEAVAKAGYAAAFSLADKPVRVGRNIFDLPRIMIVSTDKPFTFWFKTTFPRLRSYLGRLTRTI